MPPEITDQLFLQMALPQGEYGDDYAAAWAEAWQLNQQAAADLAADFYEITAYLDFI